MSATNIENSPTPAPAADPLGSDAADPFPATRAAMGRHQGVLDKALADFGETGDATKLGAIERSEDEVRSAFLSDTASYNRIDNVAAMPFHWIEELLDRHAR